MAPADRPRKYDISIVIPVYRSEKILPELIAKLREALSHCSFEVILVHDCGPDNSWQVITELCKTNPMVRGFDLRSNVGQHNAIMAGLNAVRGRIVVTMDDDLQHSPTDIEMLCDQVRAGNDVCYARFPARHHALWKRAGSKFNDLLARVLLRKPRNLYLSPFRAFSRDLADEIVKYRGTAIYIDSIILSLTRKIATVEAKHHPRLHGTGGYSLIKSTRLLLRMSTSTTVFPLRLATLMGASLSVVGMALACLLIIQRFTLNAMPVGWSSVIVASLILGGAQLSFIGIVGEYIGNIFLIISGRQQYTIASTANVDTDGNE